MALCIFIHSARYLSSSLGAGLRGAATHTREEKPGRRHGGAGSDLAVEKEGKSEKPWLHSQEEDQQSAVRETGEEGKGRTKGPTAADGCKRGKEWDLGKRGRVGTEARAGEMRWSEEAGSGADLTWS